MTMITNIQHFLDENGEVPDMSLEAQELVSFLSEIIEAVSTKYDAPVAFADTKCRTIVNGKSCARGYGHPRI